MIVWNLGDEVMKENGEFALGSIAYLECGETFDQVDYDF